MDPSAENPFTNVRLQPLYGPRTCAVTWALKPAYQDWGVLVYRSPNGLNEWSLLNLDAEPVYGCNQLVDVTWPDSSKLDAVHYRLVAEEKSTGRSLESNVINAHEQMSLADYLAARKHMMAEVLRLRRGPGRPAFLVLPGVEGAVNPGMNGSTWQLSSLRTFEQAGGMALLPDTALVAFQTWVQLLQTKRARQNRADGTGSDEHVSVPARLPGWPAPVPGSLLVLPDTDDRYVVGPVTQPFSFRSIVQVAWQVELSLLSRSDDRYHWPVPAVDPRLATPVYTHL